MNAVAFIGALMLAIVALEVGSAVQGLFFKQSRIAGAKIAGSETGRRRSSWEALLIAVFPKRFDPNASATRSNVVDLLRRAGYPYDTPGDFYAASIRYFTVYLVAGAVAAGAVYMLGLGFAAPFLAAAFIYMGLTRPYANLRTLAKKRAEAMRSNMLPGLAELESLLVAGVGVQDSMRQAAGKEEKGNTEGSLRKASGLGGPFCNLMMFLVARLEVEPAEKAIATVRAHVPDPNDVDMQLFLQDVSDFFLNSRPILSSISALRVSVHRNILEATERRAAVILQRTSILGIFAVVGLILSIILPFMNM